MFAQLCADEITVRRYIAKAAKTEAENAALRVELARLKNETGDGVQVIEIRDERAQPESYFAPF